MKQKHLNRIYRAALLLLSIVFIVGTVGCSQESDSLEAVLKKKEIVFGIAPDFAPMSEEVPTSAAVGGSTGEADDGQPTADGLSVDIANELAKRLNITPVYRFVKQSDAETALNEGEIDCYVNLAAPDIKTAARLGIIDTRMDYSQIVVTMAESGIDRLIDLDDRTVGCVSGSDARRALDQATVMKSNFGNLEDFDSEDKLIEALKGGYIDAAVIGEPQYRSNTRGGREFYTVIPDSIASGDLVLAFRLRDTTLRERIELLYEDMLSDGTLDNMRFERLG